MSPLHRDEQSLMRLDSIFKALGVETVEDIERLTSYFVVDENQSTLAQKANMIQQDNAVLIHPDQVISAIKKFADQNRLKKKDFGVKEGIAKQEEGPVVVAEVLEVEDTEEDFNYGKQALFNITDPKKIAAEAAANKKNLQRDYWNRMAEVIDDKSYRTWTVLSIP